MIRGREECGGKESDEGCAKREVKYEGGKK